MTYCILDFQNLLPSFYIRVIVLCHNIRTPRTSCLFYMYCWIWYSPVFFKICLFSIIIKKLCFSNLWRSRIRFSDIVLMETLIQNELNINMKLASNNLTENQFLSKMYQVLYNKMKLTNISMKLNHQSGILITLKHQNISIF